MFPPIKMDGADRMTRGTLCQIIEQSVTYYCMFPETADPTFPQSLCKPGTRVCEAVIGKPPPLELRIPLPPGSET